MLARPRPIATLTATLSLAALLLLPAGPWTPVASAQIGSTAPEVRALAGLDRYVNLSDTASNWTSDFYSVVWPTGPFSAIRLEIILTNFGDPWDRVDWVALNNVTLMDVTTLENTSGNNPVQRFSVNVTEYESLFAGAGHVWWQAMPNWIAACSALAPGCWSGVLSFRFTAGPPPPGLPAVVPVVPFATLTSSSPSVNGTLHVRGTYSRAEAVLFQEGQGTDEFWYVQPFASRELLWQWDNQTVVAMLPIPFINSGGALGGIDNLAEWNGTPAPGTGARPAVTADLSPWVALLNRTPWYNLTVVDNANSWQIGLALLLWNASDARDSTGGASWVNRTLGSRTAVIDGHSFASFSEPFASERYDLNWSQYLNTSGSTIDLATEATAVDWLVSKSVTMQQVSVCRTVFDVRVDNTGAVHILDLSNWTNSTLVVGNGQNAMWTEHGGVSWTIDGASAGLSSTERRNATGFDRGNYSAPSASFAETTGWFENRTSKNGVGSSAEPASLRSGGPAVPMSGRFIVAPSSGALIRGAVRVELLTAPGSSGAASVTLGTETLPVPMNDTVTANLPSLPNGTYALNVSSPTTRGPSTGEIPILVTGWAPPYVAPLISAASVRLPAGEAPWSASFNGTAQGGAPPYSWYWTFGDGGTGMTPNATHEYSATGFFTASLNVTDRSGRSTQSQIGVQVLGPLSVTLQSSPSEWSVGAPVSLRVLVVGGLGPMNYSWGALPAGCHVASLASLACTPAGTGKVSVRVLVNDSLGYSAPGWFNTSVGSASSGTGAAGAGVLLTGGIVIAAALLAAGVVWVRYRPRRST
ncbi:MAG: PKD domain-containing protein [Thermoplasmata archaeon]|nr:PKD domain-containing protein [Thermoplasmata archaeon]